MSLADTLIKALMDTLMGMGSVFMILILICLIISLFKFMNKKEPPATGEAVPASNEIASEEDDGELIAVITAALRMAMAAEGQTYVPAGTSAEPSYIVKSIKRRR